MLSNLILLTCIFISARAQENEFQISFVTQQMNQYCDLRAGGERSGSPVQDISSKPIRAGKAGPKGDKGPPGEVDYARLERYIDDKLTEPRQKQLSPDDLNLFNKIKAGICQIKYQGKCFWIVAEKMTVAQGRALCQSIGGNAANIYDSTHMELFENYVEEKKYSGEFATGMKYSSKDRTAKLSNGTAASYVQWYRGRVSSSTTKTSITVHTGLQAMTNVAATENVNGVFCEL